MVSVVAQVTHTEETVNMLNKIVKNVLDFGVIIAIGIVLTSCASGGGSAGVAIEPSYTPPPTTTTNPDDKRHQFESFSDTFTQSASSLGYNKVTYQVGEFNDTQWVNGKYTVEDFSFLQVVIDGNHGGKDQNDPNSDEYSEPGNWMTNASLVIENDVNLDGNSDFIIYMQTFGDRNTLPGMRMLQFVNDGNGHFQLDCSVFENNVCPIVFGQGSTMNNMGWYHNEDAPVQDYNSGVAHQYDLNSDGNKDIFNVSQLWLTDNGKFVDAHSNLPDFMFENINADGVDVGIFVHDHAVGDLNGDGYNDIFMPNTTPVSTYNNGYKFFMLNDGTGNFNDVSFKVGHSAYFATSTTIADFDNDGFGDIALGWSASAYRDLGGDSVGGIYWGNTDMDYTRDYTALPPGYYENNIAFDMQVIDSNNDGLLDILIANTNADPYYQGHVLQLIINNGNRDFSQFSFLDDGATTSDLGAGHIYVLDFDHDGDMDIFVGPGQDSYVLYNNDGDWSCKNCEFARPDNGAVMSLLFPVEVDGMYEYDFIGIDIMNMSDTQTVSNFYISLDPPAQLQEMRNELFDKSIDYAKAVFNNKTMFHNIKNTSLSNSVFYVDNTHNSIAGYSHNFDNFGITLGQTNEGGLFYVDRQHGTYHYGIGYFTNSIDALSFSNWYGTGSAVLDFDTFNAYAEKFIPLSTNIFVTSGVALYQTNVAGFVEENSQYNVTVQDFTMNDIEMYTDITAVLPSQYGTTLLSAGVSSHYSLGTTDITWDGGLVSKFKQDDQVARATISHTYKMFYAKATFSSVDSDTFEVGFNLQF